MIERAWSFVPPKESGLDDQCSGQTGRENASGRRGVKVKEKGPVEGYSGEVRRGDCLTGGKRPLHFRVLAFSAGSYAVVHQ